MAQLQRGVVKWFNDAKGFGFIEHETGRDVFVHYSVIEADGFKTLKDGEVVDYELKEGDKGLHAARVLRTNPPPAAAKKAPKKLGFSKPSIDGEGGDDLAEELDEDFEEEEEEEEETDAASTDKVL